MRGDTPWPGFVGGGGFTRYGFARLGSGGFLL